MPELDLRAVRRLALLRQRLAGPSPSPGADGLREVLRALRCLQLDPVGVVAPSHELVLWSRVGAFERADLDRLRWEERWLFDYWAHAASIVLTEDHALHRLLMRRPPRGGAEAVWLEANAQLREHILHRLSEKGPLPTDGFQDLSTAPWESTGWTSGRNVERMLESLWIQGHVLVAGRSGRRRHWDLAERLLPRESEHPGLPDGDVVSRTAELALLALGAGRVRDIRKHFVRGRYPGLEAALTELEERGRVLRVRVARTRPDEPWYVHRDALPDLERAEAWPREPRTTLLSPFDNLLCDRERTELVWGFAFRNEMYVPRDKREFGYYVLPVLHGDRLVGRAALRVDRRTRTLNAEGVFAEEGTAGPAEAAPAVAAALTDLAGFAGADRVRFTGPVPGPWRSALGRELTVG
ncbi:DNA glycosylase AlkZ-like family protein [Nocardiopsis ganjiahuensis]|uniref:DNA glycosylase AlkZ-like family protein n=1 Tax=Nocardiopsis ganjiahuensis TaxID=239984 RepID=UPI001EF9DBEB|nr:crosslink repair DNA glycosylase YcaQ family protein [Nocardiopsis ganjiahuensis]